MRATVRIERFADQGRCVAHIDGRVVFVRFALPGELAQIELDESHDREGRFWTAEVVDVLEASPDRCEPAWPLAGPLLSPIHIRRRPRIERCKFRLPTDQ